MTVEELQSKQYKHLLDIVDKLRLYGVTRYIDLPQIIVCGDQSAGKSSVLEAISRLQFPTEDSLCTRFAVELILRRADVTTINVLIHAGPDRSREESDRLAAFKYEVDPVDPDLHSVIESAKHCIGISEARGLSSDILRIEVQGPEQPHLTLVDLPGLFRAGNREQSTDEAPIVLELVRKYMANPRSIILAVVSAKNEFPVQEVTALARELDPSGLRTLGLITKPDTLSRGSNSESAYITMAQNRDVVFRHGWHVLMNRSFETRDVSMAVRDEEEAKFFRSGPWTSLDPSLVGIKSLRLRLSSILGIHILQNVPSLMSDIGVGIEECRKRLVQLGDARGTTKEQRQYLQRVSWRFAYLLRMAIEGTYTDPFFGHSDSHTSRAKRLRAVLQNSLEAFSESMRTKGHTERIVDDTNFAERSQHANVVVRSAYLRSVRELIQHNKGAELPGTFNPAIVGELFRKQCRPWPQIIEHARSDILAHVQNFVRAVLREIAAEDNVDSLFADINRTIRRLGEQLHSRADDLLRPYLTGHPITYNRHFIQNVREMQSARLRKRMQILVDQKSGGGDGRSSLSGSSANLVATTQELEESYAEQYACECATDYMQAYYEIAMQTVVDDFGIHAVEEQLIQKLPTIFDLGSLEQLTDTEVANLAAENITVTHDRAHNLDKLARLELAMEELRPLDPGTGCPRSPPKDSQKDRETQGSKLRTPNQDNSDTRPIRGLPKDSIFAFNNLERSLPSTPFSFGRTDSVAQTNGANIFDVPATTPGRKKR